MSSNHDQFGVFQPPPPSDEEESTFDRRSVLRAASGVGAHVLLGGCGGKDNAPNASTEGGSYQESSLETTSPTPSSHAVRCVLTPAQVEGPFYFTLSGSRVKMAIDQEGVPLEINLSVVDQACQPVSGARVEVWHADVRGIYSGFAEQVVDTTNQDFLRGDMVSDTRGQVYFQSIYPGWYPGRAVHVHFKVSIDNTVRITSQFYLPDQVSHTVYQHATYQPRGMQDTPLSQDRFLQSTGHIQTNLIASVIPERAGYIAQLRITI